MRGRFGLSQGLYWRKVLTDTKNGVQTQDSKVRAVEDGKPTWPRDKWVPVTTAWRVLRLRMEERPPIWRVAANILNKRSRTDDKGWVSSMGFGQDVNNSLP